MQLDRLNFRDWIDTPEAWFMTAAEHEEWNKAVTFDAAQKFIADYETRRGPLFADDIRRRVDFADKTFGTTSTRGSQTQMGRVWIILGSPNQQKRADRGGSAMNLPGMPAMGTNNSIEQNAFQRTTWVYRKDRLPQQLGTSEMTVTFQTDVNRGQQTIENPGLIEPYLRKAGSYFGEKMLADAARRRGNTPAPAKATTPVAALGPSPLWQVADKLDGVTVSGGAFISPTERPFFAVDFYVPKSAAAFNGVSSVVVAAALKDAGGAEINTANATLPLNTYDASGDRYVDRSFPLAPGKYTGAFALYAPDGTTLLAKTQRDFEIVPADASGVSPVMLSSHVDTLEKQEAFDPFTFVATKYAIKGDGSFRAADNITAFTIVSNPSPQPEMTMSMTVMKDGKKFDKTPPDPVPLTQTGPHTYLIAAQFPPKAFPPGHYLLQLDLNDTKAAKKYTAKGEFDIVP